MTAETAMWLSGGVMMISVAVAFWNLEHCKDGAANAWLAVALVALALFMWADVRAEMRHELKHAAEHRAVQKQLKAVQRF